MTTMDMFSRGTPLHQWPTPLHMQDGDVYYRKAFFSASSADDLFRRIQNEVAWRQEEIHIWGKPVALPRLTAWYGDKGTVYTYSGLDHEPNAWTPSLLEIRKRVEKECRTTFNSLLLNLYRDGSDSVSWHADDEPELGPEPVIASVSLGEAREFKLKHRTNGARHSVLLEHGDLLVMSGDTQKNWLHQIPKSKKPMSERINLTFRQIGPRQ